MDPDLKQYLLRTSDQISAFRTEHALDLKMNAAAYRRWILSLPMMEWVPLILPAGQEGLAIGIICILYIDGFVNINLHDSMKKIQRCPLNEEEELAWMKATGWHGPRIDGEDTKTDKNGHNNSTSKDSLKD